MGRKGAVESLLDAQESRNATPLPDWAERETALANSRKAMAELREIREETKDMSPERREQTLRTKRQQKQRTNRRHQVEAQTWWFQKLLKTEAPLREKMVIFWHDHFATSFRKVKQPVLLMKQNELFRSEALGSFKTLTHEILRDPAMMLYLDVQTSKKGQPNENFAREVMELFTLGEGNYTEQDIKEAARAFTGYKINRLNGQVRTNRRQRDLGEKTIFGRTEKFDGPGVVDLLFEQPAVTRMIPTKLWEFFVADNPPEEGISALARSFEAAEFQIKPLLREIFLSKAFYDPKVIRNQIKSPIQYLVQMLKELEIGSPPVGQMLAAQQDLGQVLFMPPNVAGWDWGKGWINTNTLLSRYNTAGFVTKGSIESRSANDGDSMSMVMMDDKMTQRRMNGIKRANRRWAGPDYEQIVPRPLREDPEKLVDALILRFFQAPLGAKERQAFIEYARSKKGAIFTNKETGELCHLMMSTPQYQLA